MVADATYRAFLETTRRDASRLLAQSDALRLAADPTSGDPPSRYSGLLIGAQHFERDGAGQTRLVSGAIAFSLVFPHDYLHSVDPTLQMRVAVAHGPIVHPNVHRDGRVCLGSRFVPGTRLKPLLAQLHLVLSGRVFATNDPLDKEAADFFLLHLDEVREMRAEPLWRRPVAGRVRVRSLA